MERYQNRGNDSGIVTFEIGEESITVKFHDNYLYNSIRSGNITVNSIRRLVRNGEKLNSYINRTARNNLPST